MFLNKKHILTTWTEPDLIAVHVGDVLHLWLHELVTARHVGELKHVERHPAHARLRQRVEAGHVRAAVVDLSSKNKSTGMLHSTISRRVKEVAVQVQAVDLT